MFPSGIAGMSPLGMFPPGVKSPLGMFPPGIPPPIPIDIGSVAKIYGPVKLPPSSFDTTALTVSE